MIRNIQKEKMLHFQAVGKLGNMVIPLQNALYPRKSHEIVKIWKSTFANSLKKLPIFLQFNFDLKSFLMTSLFNLKFIGNLLE